MTISSFEFSTQSIAETVAVVRAPQVRFTILTPRLIRLEYDPT